MIKLNHTLIAALLFSMACSPENKMNEGKEIGSNPKHLTLAYAKTKPNKARQTRSLLLSKDDAEGYITVSNAGIFIRREIPSYRIPKLRKEKPNSSVVIKF